MVLATLTKSDVIVPSDIVESIVEETIKEVELKGDGKIDMEEGKKYVAKTPSLLKIMTLPYLNFVLHTEAED
ncbi:hypothetical protein P8452_25758 [Trifolium repens]|nr:hypothetical protein P8452_25758 [Trifolium repens]